MKQLLVTIMIMLCATILTIDQYRSIRKCGTVYIYEVREGSFVTHREVLTEEEAKIRAEVYGKKL